MTDKEEPGRLYLVKQSAHDNNPVLIRTRRFVKPIEDLLQLYRWDNVSTPFIPWLQSQNYAEVLPFQEFTIDPGRVSLVVPEHQVNVGNIGTGMRRPPPGYKNAEYPAPVTYQSITAEQRFQPVDSPEEDQQTPCPSKKVALAVELSIQVDLPEQRDLQDAAINSMRHGPISPDQEESIRKAMHRYASALLQSATISTVNLT